MQFDFREIAEQLYNAYGDEAGWLNHLGNPMPDWASLPEPIRLYWTRSAKKAHEIFTGAYLSELIKMMGAESGGAGSVLMLSDRPSGAGAAGLAPEPVKKQDWSLGKCRFCSKPAADCDNTDH